MRMIITSDSHGKSVTFFDIAEKHIDDASLFVNLGDCNSQRDLENAKLYFGSRLNLICVSGNCDWSSDAPETEKFMFGGKKVLMCHGHTFRVKSGLSLYINEAKRRGADIALFGHTHTPFQEYIDGIYFFNPGAVLDARYGIIDVTDAGVVCIHAKI